MSIRVFFPHRISMSQKQSDVLNIMPDLLRGERTQGEAARLLDNSSRQVRRLLRRLQAGGIAALVHGLRGKPSNHPPDAKLRQAVLAAYRPHTAEFGPTFASDKLAEQGLHVAAPLLPAPNRRFNKAAREAAEAHRPLGLSHDVAAIMTTSGQRTFLMSPKGGHFYCRLTVLVRILWRFGSIIIINATPLPETEATTSCRIVHVF
jgi:hypothetical protein